MEETRETGTRQSTSTPSPADRLPGDVGQRNQGAAQRTGGSKGGAARQGENPGGSLASSASDAAQRAYEYGEDYARRTGERYPQARRYYEEGTRAVGQQISEAPLLSLLAVGAAAYALGWMIHGGQSERREQPSGRMRRRDVPGQRTGKRLIESDRVEGTAVYDPSGKRIGTVERLMIDKISGRVAYAVMSFGGFFGFGADEYAIPWSKLDYDKSLEGYRTDITAEQLRQAPSFSRSGNNEWSDPQREQELHDYYQVSYYWIVP